MEKSGGIALLCVAGLLAILAAFAVALAGQARLVVSVFPLARVAAGMSGASGMEYAAARLDGSPFPGRRDPAFRCDDWSVGSPAYPHGGGPAGAASGRLRQGSSFILKIQGLDGCVPLNAGLPRPQDRYGAALPPHGPNGIPDHRDPEIPLHRGLAHLLNNLGAILELSRSTKVQTGVPPGSGETFALSWLGNDLIERRPPRGYRRWEEVVEALEDAGYGAGDAMRLRPYLDWAPVENNLSEGGRALGDEEWDFPASIPLYAYAAPREVLAALWMHVAGDIPLTFTSFGEPWGWRKPCTRTGLLGQPGTLPFANSLGQVFISLTPVLFRDEAEGLADLLDILRGTGPLSWKGIRQALVSGAEGGSGLFARDWNDLMRAPNSAPVLARAWTHLKAQIAWQAVALDPAPFSGTASGSAAWACGGIDHDPATPQAEPFPVLGFDTPCGGILQIRYPDGPGGWPVWSQPFTSRRVEDRILPLGLSLAPPCRFRVECQGRSAEAREAVSGTLRVGSVLVVAGQEDFENLDGGRRLARRGIAVANDPDPAARRDVVDDGTGRVYPRITTVPRWNRRAVSPDGRGPDLCGASRMFGAVTLATREAGREGARLYWPFSDDFDGRLDNGGAWTAGPARDFWHEIDPAWPGQPPAGPFPALLVRTSPRPDDPFLTPLFVTGTDGSGPGQGGGGTPFRIECPGLSGPEGAPAPGFTLSCWMGTESGFSLSNQPEDKVLSLDTRRAGSDPLTGGTAFELEMNWAGRPLRTTWTVPDEELDGRISWAYHVVLVWGPSAADPGKSEFRLFVNGSDEEDFGPERVAVFDGPCLASPLFALAATRIDEVRLYDAPLDRNAARALYGDRFVRQGTWRSPLYGWDETVRFREVRWHGVSPADFTVDPFRVRMHVYADAAGAVEFPGSPVDIPGGARGRDMRLSGRAMCYEVILDCGAVPGILDDAPFFESLWLRYGPARGGARWEEWTPGIDP